MSESKALGKHIHQGPSQVCCPGRLSSRSPDSKPVLISGFYPGCSPARIVTLQILKSGSFL